MMHCGDKSTRGWMGDSLGMFSFPEFLRVGVAALGITVGNPPAAAGETPEVTVRQLELALERLARHERAVAGELHDLETLLAHEQSVLVRTEQLAERLSQQADLLRADATLQDARGAALQAQVRHQLEHFELVALTDVTRVIEEEAGKARLSLMGEGICEVEAQLLVAKTLAITTLQRVDLVGFNPEELRVAAASVERVTREIQEAPADSELGTRLLRVTPERAAALGSISFSREVLRDIPILNTAGCLTELLVSSSFKISRAHGMLMIMSSGAMAPGAPDDVRMNIRSVVDFSLHDLRREFRECLEQTSDSWERLKNPPELYDRLPGRQHAPRERYGETPEDERETRGKPEKSSPPEGPSKESSPSPERTKPREQGGPSREREPNCPDRIRELAPQHDVPRG